MPIQRVGGVDLYYERRGAGPPLLFLNGSGSTLATTGMVVDPFAARLDVVAHDQRGLGRSSIPSGPYSMADYAADALGLLDAVGWDECAVVGISFGGMVAQELAATAPARVTRLALLCTSPGGAGGSSYPLHELADLAPEERTAVGTRLLDARFTPEWLEAHPDDAALAAFMAARTDTALDDEHRRGAAEQMAARRGHDVWDRLPSITCPTLVAGGRYDGIAPPANSEAIASRVPGAELHLYEGGHAFFVQDPRALPEIVGFLVGDDEASVA